MGLSCVAAWSQADGDQFRLTDGGTGPLAWNASARSWQPQPWPVDWEKLARMPSGRLFLLRKGDVIVMPSGTYHYVYTVRTKVAIAGDFISAIGWRQRVASVERDREMGLVNVSEMVELASLVEQGLLKVELPRVRKLKQALREAEPPATVQLGDAAVETSKAVEAARDDTRGLLEWVERLQQESIHQRGIHQLCEKEEVRAALREVWAFATDRPADDCPWN